MNVEEEVKTHPAKSYSKSASKCAKATCEIWSNSVLQASSLALRLRLKSL